MSAHQAALLGLVVEAFPDAEGHYAHAVGRYCHAGFDNGATPMVVVRHPERATEGLLAALEALGAPRDPTDPRVELKRLKERLYALALTWQHPRALAGVAFELTPAACAMELQHAIEESL